MQTTDAQTIQPTFSGEGLVAFQASARAQRAGERWAAFAKTAPSAVAPTPAAPVVSGPAPANLRVLRDLLSLAKKG